jgi:hypothetical protein
MPAIKGGAMESIDPPHVFILERQQAFQGYLVLFRHCGICEACQDSLRCQAPELSDIVALFAVGCVRVILPHTSSDSPRQTRLASQKPLRQ